MTVDPDNPLTTLELALEAKTTIIPERRIQEVIEGFIALAPLTRRKQVEIRRETPLSGVTPP